MLITFVGAGVPLQPNVSGITSVTVAYPAGVQVDDLLLLHVIASTTNPGTPPTGWAALEPNLPLGSTGPAALTYYRFADTTDTTATDVTYTVPSAKYEAHMIALRNVSQVSIKDVASPTGTQSATSTMAVPPSATTATDKAWVLLFASALSLAGATNSVWSSSNMIIRNQGTSVHTTSNPTGAVATIEVSPAGTFSPTIDITPSPTRSSMRVVVLRPAPDAPPKGTSAGTWRFTGVASGVNPVISARTGFATGTWSFAGVAVGQTPRVVTDWTDPVSEITPAGGAGISSFQFIGAAVGDIPPNRGTAVGTFAYRGTTASRVVHRGIAVGGWKFTAFANGDNSGNRIPISAPITGTFANSGISTASFNAYPVYLATFVESPAGSATFVEISVITVTFTYTGVAIGEFTASPVFTAVYTTSGVGSSNFVSSGVGVASYA